MDTDRVRSVGGARAEHAGQRNALVAARVRLEHGAVAEMEPREHDQLVSGLDAMERVRVCGVDLDRRGGRALVRLVRGIRGRAQRGANDADPLQVQWAVGGQLNG